MAGDIQIRRIFLKKDAEQIRYLQQNAPEFKKHYPKHNQWLDFALKEVIEGRRYAFGIYRTSFSSTATPTIDLVGSIILKREIYTNSFELKNLYVSEQFRKKKYGSALFEVVEQFCIKRGGVQIETEVPSVEQNTVNFLSNREFYVQDHSDSLFKEGDRIYKMVKKLPTKFTGDPFDLLNLSTWTFENIYKFQLTDVKQNYFDYKIRLENGLNEKNELLIKGRSLVFDTKDAITVSDLSSTLANSDLHVNSIVLRNATKEIKDFCKANRIFLIEFNQIKDNFKHRFSTEFQHFEKEQIKGMIVPINYRYYSAVKESHIGLTYFKGGPTGKFLKEDDYVLLCFEDSPDYSNGGIKAYAKIEKSSVGSPDEIWHAYKDDKPIFPENEYMAWSADKAHIVAFKIKDLKFINTINVRDITKQKEVTPFDNERLGQFYLEESQINLFLETREELTPGSYDDSSVPKIFLSSTVNDLVAERSEVSELAKNILSYNIFCSENAGGFSTPRDTIIEEIKSSDIYICIVGQKYGYENTFDGRYISATHDEFNNAKKYNKKILVYVKNIRDREKKADDFLKEIGDYFKGEKYQLFNSAKELKDVVKKDLAKILKPQ